MQSDGCLSLSLNLPKQRLALWPLPLHVWWIVVLQLSFEAGVLLHMKPGEGCTGSGGLQSQPHMQGRTLGQFLQASDATWQE